MPIYEYACGECDARFEELVRGGEQAVRCPSCGSAAVVKQLSAFAVHAVSAAQPAAPPAARVGGGCCGGGCGCGHH